MTQFIEKIKSKLSQKSPLYLRVKIYADAPMNKIFDQLEDETYKIKVAAKPIRGKSNAELIRFLKKSLGASEVAIVSGGREKLKLIRVSS